MPTAFRLAGPALLAALLPLAAVAGATTPVVLLDPTGEDPGEEFGWSVASAGDVNGDGYDDVIAGARWNDSGGTDAGRAYVFFGGPAADAVADWVLTGTEPGALFGSSAAGVGDVDGDGYDDVLVGAPLADGIWADAGKAFLFRGGAAPDTVPDLVMVGQTYVSAQMFGGSLSAAGDLNHDGRPDFVVASASWSADRGRCYVFFGGASLDSIPDLILSGEASYDSFGGSVSGAGDVNHDGFDDLVVGAVGQDYGGDAAGRAYVFLGGSPMDDVPDWILSGHTVLGKLGSSVGGAGDVNGDACDDLIVGAEGENKAYVFLGGASPDTLPDVTLSGTGSFGASVSGAGDMNADGFADVIVGARFDDTFAAHAGRARVYFGSLFPDPGADLDLLGEAADDQLGIAVAGAGDVNGDGLDDVVVGAFLNDQAGSGAGKAYVISQADLTSVPGGTHRPPRLRAWPLPYRGAALHVEWEGATEVPRPMLFRIFDVEGRLRWTGAGSLANPSATAWDGRDDSGRSLGAGIYFLKVTGVAGAAVARIPVVR